MTNKSQQGLTNQYWKVSHAWNSSKQGRKAKLTVGDAIELLSEVKANAKGHVAVLATALLHTIVLRQEDNVKVSYQQKVIEMPPRSKL